MLNLSQFDHPGEYPFSFQGAVGSLEAIYLYPPNARITHIALLGHPHSQQGGTMQNKVVTTMARAFKELGIPSIRFNFRGVGQSLGTFDDGIGESDDMLLLSRACREEFPEVTFLFAGFSFGSYVTYRAASQCPNQLLISIAPPVERYDYEEFSPSPSPWVIVQGDGDEVVSFEAVHHFVEQSKSPITFIVYPETGHFFHGKLIELKQTIIQTVSMQQGIL